MKKPTGTTDPNLTKLLRDLQKHSSKKKVPLWKNVARLLKRSRRQRIAYNISRLSRNTNENEIVIVPGKLLGTGTIDHPLTVSAWDFSENARSKISRAGGKCMTIRQMMEKYPSGKDLRLMA
ncbi:MAG: 50S ribosomal protein L18e [Candidatus Ranarchaeia archaeon]